MRWSICRGMTHDHSKEKRVIKSVQGATETAGAMYLPIGGKQLLTLWCALQVSCQFIPR